MINWSKPNEHAFLNGIHFLKVESDNNGTNGNAI